MLGEKGLKWKEGTFRLDIRKKNFTGRVVRHWAQVGQRSECPLPGSVLNHVGWSSEQPGILGSVPANGRELELNNLWGSFQLRQFYDCMICSVNSWSQQIMKIILCCFYTSLKNIFLLLLQFTFFLRIQQIFKQRNRCWFSLPFWPALAHTCFQKYFSKENLWPLYHLALSSIAV